MNYLDCKTVDTAISRAKIMLIQKAKKSGLYENFGANEQRALNQKFFDWDTPKAEREHVIRSLNSFEDWCATLTQADLKKY